MNTHVVICEDTNTSAIIDPGADAEKILSLTAGTNVNKILLTHAHEDHIGALEQVKANTGAPIHLHPADASNFNVRYDVPLRDNDEIVIGNQHLQTIHTPGHTPGMTCFNLGEFRIIVGDTIFVGGPGKTWSAEDFKQTMRTMQDIVFMWPDEIIFFPGHGPSGRIGDERPAFEGFVSRGWSDDLYGDVTWE
jgi:glyoxylase-like metal-dependent hydrolase (beta-lactamase superfamily II)